MLFAIKFLEAEKNLKDDFVIYVFLSDHIIKPVTKLKTVLDKAYKLINNKDLMVAFGVKPSSPKESYGYFVPVKSSYMISEFVEARM